KTPWAIIIAAGVLVAGLAFYFLGGSNLFRGSIVLKQNELAGIDECVKGIPNDGLMENLIYPLEIQQGCEVQFATTNESKAKIVYSKIISTGAQTDDPLEISFNSENNLPNPKLIWNFGDGQTQENEGNNQTSHTYTAYGQYTVTVSASATIEDKEVTLTATKIITIDVPQNPDYPAYPAITPASEPNNSNSSDNDTPEITFVSSLWADIFHADTTGLPELVNPITVHYGDGVLIVTKSLDETAENIIQIRFNNQQWDLDIQAEGATAEEEVAAEDPIQQLKKMAETVADGGDILDYLLIDEDFQKHIAKYKNIGLFIENAEAILKKLKQFLVSNKDLITAKEFEQVQGLFGLIQNDIVVPEEDQAYTPEKIDKKIASLDLGLSQILAAKEIYKMENLTKKINEEFLIGVLGFEDGSLQVPECADALKNLQLTAGELNEEGEVTLTLSPIGIPTPCLDNGLQNKEIQMKKINGKYFPMYFSPGSKVTELDILADAAKTLTPEV
ncbi:MAG: PKD domain-containing protein, partial [Patescibacteria group bacterium]